MLSKKDINSLSFVINDAVNKNIKYDIAKKKINFIFHNKSVKTVIKELSVYIDDIKGNEKNKAVLVVIMSLLRRNLDCVKELSLLIFQYKLTRCLYGGLQSFLSGNSERFRLKTKLSDNSFENKYEYITRFSDFYYWELIVLFESVKVLSLVDSAKVEQLAFDDQSKLILLNMVTHHLDIKPSNDLILKLIQSNDELKQNIGFSFLTEKIVRGLEDICELKSSKESGFLTTKNINAVRKTLNAEIGKCCTLLESCNIATTASLLFNYLLVHQMQYPDTFAQMLMSSRLQEEFAKQIKETNKIRMLKDLSFLVVLIFRTPALNDEKRRISKANLYNSVTDVLITFIEEDKGIYGWDEQQKKYIKEICERLPSRALHTLRSCLLGKRKTLMCTKIDELVRFEIYLKDKRKQEIIDGILTVIEAGD